MSEKYSFSILSVFFQLESSSKKKWSSSDTAFSFFSHSLAKALLISETSKQHLLVFISTSSYKRQYSTFYTVSFIQFLMRNTIKLRRRHTQLKGNEEIARWRSRARQQKIIRVKVQIDSTITAARFFSVFTCCCCLHSPYAMEDLLPHVPLLSKYPTAMKLTLTWAHTLTCHGMFESTSRTRDVTIRKASCHAWSARFSCHARVTFQTLKPNSEHFVHLIKMHVKKTAKLKRFSLYLTWHGLRLTDSRGTWWWCSSWMMKSRDVLRKGFKGGFKREI